MSALIRALNSSGGTAEGSYPIAAIFSLRSGEATARHGEEVPAETIVPDAKEYISETIDDPEAIYDPAIWDTSGFALVLSWLAQKWNQRCRKLAPLGSKNPEQYLTKEQQKACLEMAAAELIREITQGGSLH
jgi:hypothetical protein